MNAMDVVPLWGPCIHSYCSLRTHIMRGCTSFFLSGTVRGGALTLLLLLPPVTQRGAFVAMRAYTRLERQISLCLELIRTPPSLTAPNDDPLKAVAVILVRRPPALCRLAVIAAVSCTSWYGLCLAGAASQMQEGALQRKDTLHLLTREASVQR